MENGEALELADQLFMEHLAERRARANQVLLVAELAEHYILPAGAEVVHGKMVDALVEEVCRSVNLGHLPLAAVDIEEWKKDPGVFVQENAGEVLYRLRKS